MLVYDEGLSMMMTVVIFAVSNKKSSKHFEVGLICDTLTEFGIATSKIMNNSFFTQQRNANSAAF
jgi:hypothetical protein